MPELSMLEFSSPLVPTDAAGAGLDGESERIERVRGRAEAVARNGFTAALVTGEPGCGKRRLARWMHGLSRRGSRPLVTVDATSPAAVDVVRGLTQSVTHRDAGLHPGNVVVDNFQAASVELAQLLVELLTAQGVELRCGLLLLGTEGVSVLRGLSAEHGRLLGRTASAVVEIPPLRERPEDIPVLARAFLEDAARYYGRDVRGLSPQAAARLQQHPYPGNARELRALVEQALLRSNSEWISVEDVPLRNATVEAAPQAEIVIRLPGSSLREIELQAIRLALRLASGRLVRASELLGITRHALRRKLEKYGLNELRSPPNGSALTDRDDAFI